MAAVLAARIRQRKTMAALAAAQFVLCTVLLALGPFLMMRLSLVLF
jgi:hypothetical protein